MIVIMDRLCVQLCYVILQMNKSNRYAIAIVCCLFLPRLKHRFVEILATLYSAIMSAVVETRKSFSYVG